MRKHCAVRDMAVLVVEFQARGYKNKKKIWLKMNRLKGNFEIISECNDGKISKNVNF